MATKILRSIKGRVVRLTRLDVCGFPVVGPASVVVSKGFITVTLTEEVEDGEEISQKNAWGEYEIQEKDDDILKWVTTAIEFSEVHPDVMEIVGGATPVIHDGNTVGWTRGPNAAKRAFAVEVWTKKAGVDACEAAISVSVVNKVLNGNVATLTTLVDHGLIVGQEITVTGVDATFNGVFTVTAVPAADEVSYAKVAGNVASSVATGNVFAEATPEWGYFLVPFVKNGRPTSDIVIANAVLNVTLAGQGYGATDAWDLGPHGDDPFLEPFPEGEMYGGVVTNVQPPAPTDGVAELAALDES